MDAFNRYKLKTIPLDFLVAEALILPTENTKELDQFHYYFLKKCGYTTFQAIDYLANKLQIDRNLIGYAGLKDEDGITEQHISFPSKIEELKLKKINRENQENSKFLKLNYLKKGTTPIQIGSLIGNNFRVVIRNLPEHFATALNQQKKFSTLFMNYYGPQRFGLANTEKKTHLIGEHLIKKDYQKAFNLLSIKNKPCDAKKFFQNLNPRDLAFYYTSYYSYLWNEELKKTITLVRDEVITHTQDDISYLYLVDNNAKCKLIQNSLIANQIKFTAHNCEIKRTESQRHILEKITILCQQAFPDSFHLGTWACEIDFFLPSGSYASIAIPQVLYDFEKQMQ